jgi:tRNA nucleotidyltransferase (CCA-adding enzyme)
MQVKQIPPGPAVGRIKHRMFEKVLEDPALNTREHLLSMLQDMD